MNNIKFSRIKKMNDLVADSRFPREGRFIEEVGYYNPYKE